jgi:hypothetical protein
MENGSRTGAGKKYLHGLKKCIEEDARLAAREKQLWEKHKDRMNALLNSPDHGTCHGLRPHPLTKNVIQYCVQDAVHLTIITQYLLQTT